MNFPQSLVRGVLQRRYKRFLADVTLANGETRVVHVPNPGAMLGLVPPGAGVWLAHSPSPLRKLAYTLELVETPRGLVGVNTLLANRLVLEAIAAGRLPPFATPCSVESEVRYGTRSRADVRVLGLDGVATWIEVKSVTLSRVAGLAEWPDCVSARGAKHAGELAGRVRAGERGVILFVLQRADCERMTIAADLDPAFARALADARAAGVEVMSYDCDVGVDAIELRRPVPFIFRSDPAP